MRTRSSPWFLLLALPLALGLGACGDTTDATPDGGDGGTDAGTQFEDGDHAGTCTDGVDNDADGYTDCDDFDCSATAECNPDTLSIYDLQDESSNLHPTPGTRTNPGPEVTVEGVVVTAVNPVGEAWDIHVQEPEGGPYSGILVFGSLTEVAVGDVVDVTGEFKEYYDLSEIAATTVTLTGETAEVTPEVVDAAELATETGGAEQWEGVLVEVRNVAVTAAKVNGSDGKWHGDWEVDDGLMIGNAFGYGFGALDGDAFQSIVGPLDFNYDRYKVQPRSDEDIVLAGGEVACTWPIVDVAIQTIQNLEAADHPNPCSDVRVTGAVVTAVRTNADAAVTAFTMQQGTGAYSGVWVQVPAEVDAGALAVGDEVTVEGAYVEYFDLTQVSATVVTVSGTGTVPAPEAITDPALVKAVFAKDETNTAEPWEGVLVTLDPAEDMAVTQAPSQYGEWMLGLGADADLVLVDDEFHGYDAKAAERIDAVTGVMSYGYGKYRLLPRSADDVVSNGMPTDVEGLAGTCNDGIDNDGNGDVDCADTACAADVVCTASEATISDIQQLNGVAVGDAVKVVDAVVTGVGSEGFFIQQGTGAYSGIYVYLGYGVAPTVVRGDQVTVYGTADAFRTMEQLTSPTVEVTGSGVALPAPEALDLTAFSDVTGMEQWEAVLVQVTRGDGQPMVADNTPVVGNPPEGTYGEFTLDGGALAVDDLLYLFPASEGQEIESITGIVNWYQTSSGAAAYFRLLPRDLDDVATVVPVVAEVCDDTTDNDGDGFVDCNDLDCSAEAACAEVSSTVQAVRSGDVQEGVTVGVTGAVVTAVRSSGFWMQEGTGAYSGIYVYTGGVPTVAAGDLVDVTGEYSEYNGTSQLGSGPTVTAQGAGTLPTPEALTPVDFADAAAMEQWESVLVQVARDDGQPMVADNTPDPANAPAGTYGEFTVEGGAVVVDDKLFFSDAVTAGTELQSITGPVEEAFGSWRILPRSADDLDIVPAQ